jgi:hypothetical protein
MVKLIKLQHQLAAYPVVAHGHQPSHPHALLLRGRDLVPNPLPGNFPFKLREGKKDVERQPFHRTRGVELLGHGDKGLAWRVARRLGSLRVIETLADVLQQDPKAHTFGQWAGVQLQTWLLY